MRTRIPVTASALALVIATATPAHADEPVDCVLNLDTGALTCAPGAVASLTTTYTLARLYTASGYGGSSLTLEASTPCDTNSDVDHSWASLPSAFNDTVSSFTGYNNCQVKLFEHVSYGGSSVGPATSMSYVGDAMNDEASSVQLS